MPTNLLLLPLRGGFWLVHFCHYFRFHSQRLDGYRLLIESAIAGLFLASLSRIIVSLTSGLPWVGIVREHWEHFSPFPFSGSAAGAVLLGLVLPFIINFFWDEEWSRDRALKKHSDLLFKLIHRSVKTSEPIAVTYARTSPNLDPLEKYFDLIPIMSGYRDSVSLEVKKTAFYENVYAEDVDRNDFAIAIPLASVTTAHLFDENVDPAMFVPKSDGDEE